LTARAQRTGYHPDVILASRRINDGMAGFVADRTIRLLIDGGIAVAGARVGVLGLAFKPGVSDLRNSGAVKIIQKLSDYGVTCLAHDPRVEPATARQVAGVDPVPLASVVDLDALILAVPHPEFLALPVVDFTTRIRSGGVLVDLSARLDRNAVGDACRYWSL
jgi:UDP-N-acetyl-D-galactosamine dehydrogenase